MLEAASLDILPYCIRPGTNGYAQLNSSQMAFCPDQLVRCSFAQTSSRSLGTYTHTHIWYTCMCICSTYTHTHIWYTCMCICSTYTHTHMYFRVYIYMYRGARGSGRGLGVVHVVARHVLWMAIDMVRSLVTVIQKCRDQERGASASSPCCDRYRRQNAMCPVRNRCGYIWVPPASLTPGVGSIRYKILLVGAYN